MASKIKGKQWVTIISPKIFGEKEIGQTLTSTPDGLVGKRVVLSAVELMNDMNKYYLKFKFKVKSVTGNKAYTEFDGSECLQDYISRMVLRRVRRIDSVQDLVTKDNIKVRVKGLTIVSKRVKSSLEKKIREYISELIKSMIESYTSEKLIEKFVSNEIKNNVIKEARKIYPIRNFEIRKIEVRQA